MGGMRDEQIDSFSNTISLGDRYWLHDFGSLISSLEIGFKIHSRLTIGHATVLPEKV